MDSTEGLLPESKRLDPSEICTLSEDGLNQRLALVRNSIQPHAIKTDRLGNGWRIEFRGTPQLAQDIDHLIRVESECCRGITFERLASEIPGQMRLEIRGVDPDAPALQSLSAPTARDQPGTAARLAKSAGAGALTSFLVCCVLPTAAAALLGAVALPLASLDGPVPITLGAVLVGAAVWRWLGRRRHPETGGGSSAGVSCGPDC